MTQTKWDLISMDEQIGLEITDCGLNCAGCDEYLATEGDFARHFIIPDSRYKNLGYCPNVPRF